MQCITLKKGTECAFMNAKGCTFNGGRCYPVVEQCEGCSRTGTFEEGIFCTVAPNPAQKWNGRPCNFATHVQRAKEAAPAQKLNPLKASKRAAGKK
ncbi:MAG: PxxKW family cysteine-rich protein [Desulfomonile sp.]|nr:PxxKW family cysteine-rich protein [Desulfomonile sp.]